MRRTDDGWQALVPPEKHAAVARALRGAVGTAEVKEVSRLTGGGSPSVVFRFSAGGRTFVARVILHVHALNDPVRQYACLSTAAEAGISPAVRYADPADGVSVTDYIPSLPLRQHPGSLLVALVNAIKAIQSTPLFPPVMHQVDAVDGFIVAFRASGLLPEQATHEHFRHYARIQEAYPRHDTDFVSSHNDLNPRNILSDGARLWVIDWESGFRNDRYADLANVANFFFRNEPETGEPGDEEETLLRAYFDGAPSEYQRARFFLMRVVCAMSYGMLLTLLTASRRVAGHAWDARLETPRLREFHRQFADPAREDPLASAEGQFLYAKVWLNEALRHMMTPRFAESVRRVEKG